MAKENLKKVEENETGLTGTSSSAEVNELVNSLIRKNTELENKVAMLINVADKRAINNYFLQNKEKISQTIRLRTFNGKVVISWKVVKDEVMRDPRTLAWTENQIMELVYEDGSKEEVNMLVFARLFSYENFTKKAVTVDDEERELLTLSSNIDGRIIKVDSVFIN